MLRSRLSGLLLVSFVSLALSAPLLAPPPASAQQRQAQVASPSDDSHLAAAPRTQAVRLSGPIQIDGRLDEATWAAAPVMTEFTQTRPVEGAPASERTEVRFLFDDDAVYVGAMLYDSHPVSTILGRRDASMSESDVFAVLLDSYHNHQTAYRFATNPSGMKHDQSISSGRTDSSWDPIWEVATQITEEGWSVEMRIPFSQLRFNPEEEQVWGLQVERTIRRNQEEAVFAFTPLLEQGGVHRYGHLFGIEGIRSGQRLELLPYVGGRVEALRATQPDGVGFGNPFRGSAEPFASAGLDLKFRLTSNLTLDATANPDFGQVEVDPAVINLTAFETRFQERRPFFIEGADVLHFGDGAPRGSVGNAPDVLYSRRIGRQPQGSVPSSAVFSDVPSSTTILGAFKLTGRVGDGWAVGLLEAVTARETAGYVDASGERGQLVVEPATNYLVGRLRRDFRGGESWLGAIVTGVNRDLSDPGTAARLHSAAYSFGVDLVHHWSSRAWRVNASFIPTYVTGEAAALRLTQTGSTRYFQRPDAGHLTLNEEATSLSGYYAMTMVEKQAGTWTGRLGFGFTSPGFEANDLGFHTSADRIVFDTHFQYNQTRPGRYLRNWMFYFSPNGVWNYDGDHLLDNTNASGRVQFLNYWVLSSRADYSVETYDDRTTRGGPMMVEPATWRWNVSVTSDSRKAYTIRGGFNLSGDEGGSSSRSGNLNVNFKPRENWEFQIGPQLSTNRNAAQYVQVVPDARAEETFGARYVFGELDQTTLSVETRVNVTFTPALSLQIYAQPFISSGDYAGYKELRAPRTFEFNRFGEDGGSIVRQEDGFFRIDPDGSGGQTFLIADRDFNLRSLRGNAVLRWEWRAGSTLFLVWQQVRSEQVTGRGLGADPGDVGTFAVGRETREMFGIKPDNIFAIKVSYWLNP